MPNSDDLDAAWMNYQEDLQKLWAYEQFVDGKSGDDPAHDEYKAKAQKSQDAINKIYMEIQAEAVAQATPVKSVYSPQVYHPSVYFTMDLAPMDGTIIMLLVDTGASEAGGFYDGEYLYWTIGFNTLEDTEIDCWEFVGWDWGNDAFISALSATHLDKSAKIIGWKPFPKLTKGEDK